MPRGQSILIILSFCQKISDKTVRSGPEIGLQDEHDEWSVQTFIDKGENLKYNINMGTKKYRQCAI